MSFVLDTSVALAWLLPDEQSAVTDALADRLSGAPVHVPAIWPLEVRDALLMALRRKRIRSAEFEERLSVLDALPAVVDIGAGTEATDGIVELARRFDLTAYDAAYLELARRRGLPLATLDARLRKACGALKIGVLP